MDSLPIIIFENTLRMVKARQYPDIDDLIREVEKISQKQKIISPDNITVGDFDFGVFYKKELSDFESRFKMSYRVVDEDEKRENYIIFVNGNKAGADVVMEIIDKTQRENRQYRKYYDVIVPKDFKAQNRQRMDENEKVFELRIYEERYFMALPTHSLGSSYEEMTKEESDKMMSEFEINSKQMKTISRNENIIKYFGFSKGSVLRIFRKPVIKGALVQETLDYRLVV